MGIERDSASVMIYDNNAGVDATGVFVALYQLMENADENYAQSQSSENETLTLNMFLVVDELRKQRTQMVRTLPQYQFLCRCLQGYAQRLKFYSDVYTATPPNVPTSTIQQFQQAQNPNQMASRMSDNQRNSVTSTYLDENE